MRTDPRQQSEKPRGRRQRPWRRPGAHGPSPARAGEPAPATGPGTELLAARRRPGPPATARRSPPRLPAARSRSPCCWRCRATWRSRGGCARARTSDAAVLESSAWTTFCDTLFLLVSGDLGEDGRRRRYNGFSSAPTRSLQGDRHAPESVIGMAESLIGMHRNPRFRLRHRPTCGGGAVHGDRGSPIHP